MKAVKLTRYDRARYIRADFVAEVESTFADYDPDGDTNSTIRYGHGAFVVDVHERAEDIVEALGWDVVKVGAKAGEPIAVNVQVEPMIMLPGVGHIGDLDDPDLQAGGRGMTMAECARAWPEQFAASSEKAAAFLRAQAADLARERDEAVVGFLRKIATAERLSGVGVVVKPLDGDEFKYIALAGDGEMDARSNDPVRAIDMLIDMILARPRPRANT